MKRKSALALLVGALTCQPAAAARVVTLAPNLAELVCDAGACDQLVGVSAYSDQPASVTRLPVVGDAFGANLEVLLALKPDWVLAWRGGNSAAQIERIRKLGLRVELPGGEGLDGIAAALTQIGAWLGTAAVADRAAADYRQRLDSLRARWRDARKLRVVYEIGTSPFYTVSDRSPIGEAIGVCGGINVFSGLSQVAGVVAPEALVVAAPQVVIHGRDEADAEVRRFWSRLPGVPAVKSGDIDAIDATAISRPTPAMLDGIDEMCAAIDRARTKMRPPAQE